MKKLNKYLLLLAAAVFTFTACEKDIEREPSPAFEGSSSVFFPVSSESQEMEPTVALEHEIKIARDTLNSEEITVKLIVVNNDENIFEVPESVKFAAGVKETSFVVKFPKAQVDGTYNLALELEPIQSNPYLEVKSSYSYTVNIAKWDLVTDKQAIIFDGIVNVFFSTGNPGWYVSYARKNNADGSFDIRLLNPYTVLPEYDMTVDPDAPYDHPIADEFGLYSGFPSNYPADVDSEGTYNMTIHVDAKGNATFDRFAMGMTWSYGAFSGAHSPSNGMGIYNNADKSITFPGGSVACSMSDYKEGAFYLGSEPLIVFLDDALWKDINSSISIAGLEGGFNDESIEWIPLEGELKTFISAIQSDGWDLSIEKAVDPNPEDKQGEGSDFFNLFRLKDVYAKGFGLAFYWDQEKGKISLPVSLQPTGLEFASKKIFIGPSAENESFVEDVELQGNTVKVFHFFLQLQTSDGGNVGEYEELFYFGPKAVVWSKEDYIGKFELSGLSPFDDSADVRQIEIKAEGDDLIIQGIGDCDTIWASFDEASSALVIAPQALSSTATYQGVELPLTLYTMDVNGDPSETAVIKIVQKLSGKAVLADDTEAVGFLIDLGGLGWWDGIYDLVLTPQKSGAAAPARKANAGIRNIINFKPVQKKKNELKINGKVPAHNYRFLQ